MIKVKDIKTVANGIMSSLPSAADDLLLPTGTGNATGNQLTGSGEEEDEVSDETLSPLQKHFLVVLILAGINVVLGAIYLWITQYGGQRSNGQRSMILFGGGGRRGDGGMEKAAYDRQRKRKMSTHISASMGKQRRT